MRYCEVEEFELWCSSRGFEKPDILCEVVNEAYLDELKARSGF